MNIAIISGNVTKDAEYRTTTTGKGVCTFTLAVKRDKDHTDFLPVVVWNRGAYELASYCADGLKKGKRATVHGRIQTRSYETQNGDKRYVTEIIANEVEWEKEKRDQSTAGQTSNHDGFEPLDDEQCPF